MSDDYSIKNLKKLMRFLMPFGMLSSVSFATMVVLGELLWPNYNPVRDVISDLTASGAPNATLMRILSNVSYVSLIVFAAGMFVLSFAKYEKVLQVGYSLLYIMALTTIVGFDTFPLSMNDMLASQNVLHLIITTVIICTTAISLVIIACGYLKHDNLLRLGWVLLVLSILFIVFNAAFYVSEFLQADIKGLIERLGIYTFYLYIFVLSCVYAFSRYARS